jgi:hypothetical protein
MNRAASASAPFLLTLNRGEGGQNVNDGTTSVESVGLRRNGLDVFAFLFGNDELIPARVVMN